MPFSAIYVNVVEDISVCRWKQMIFVAPHPIIIEQFSHLFIRQFARTIYYRLHAKLKMPFAFEIKYAANRSVEQGFIVNSKREKNSFIVDSD